MRYKSTRKVREKSGLDQESVDHIRKKVGLVEKHD